MLYSEKMKQLLEKFGVDTSTLPDNLYSTLLDAIYNVEVAQNVELVDNPSGGLASLNSIVKKVDIPYGISYIVTGAFENCTSLASINIPDSVTSIRERAFYNCSSLTSVNIPNGVPRIEDSTFWQCTSLTSINIPDSVTSIGSMAFINCKSLESITIGNGVKSIGSQAIQGCAIKSINIPDSVTSIGSMAFINCKSLANIYYKGTEEQWNAITKGSNWNSNMGSNVEGGTKIHYNYTG